MLPLTVFFLVIVMLTRQLVMIDIPVAHMKITHIPNLLVLTPSSFAMRTMRCLFIHIVSEICATYIQLLAKIIFLYPRSLSIEYTKELLQTWVMVMLFLKVEIR